jgi:hypothetical protein
MPSGYEKSPEYGGKPPLNARRALPVVFYGIVMGVIVLLSR